MAGASRRSCAKTTPFRDVGDDGDRGPHELIAARQRAWAAKRRREGRRIAGDAGRDLGDQQSAWICAEHHRASVKSAKADRWEPKAGEAAWCEPKNGPRGAGKSGGERVMSLKDSTRNT